MTAAIRLKRKARGERPYFFADPNVDKVIAMVMGLAGEVAVMRDRLDTLERLLERTGALQRADIDAYRPEAEVVAERSAWREAFLSEVLRIVEIEVEALASGDTERYDSAIRLVEAAPPVSKPARQAKPARAAAKKKATARPVPKKPVVRAAAKQPAKKKGATKKAAARRAKPAGAARTGPATRKKIRARR